METVINYLIEPKIIVTANDHRTVTTVITTLAFLNIITEGPKSLNSK